MIKVNGLELISYSSQWIQICLNMQLLHALSSLEYCNVLIYHCFLQERCFLNPDHPPPQEKNNILHLRGSRKILITVMSSLFVQQQTHSTKFPPLLNTRRRLCLQFTLIHLCRFAESRVSLYAWISPDIHEADEARNDLEKLTKVEILCLCLANNAALRQDNLNRHLYISFLCQNTKVWMLGQELMLKYMMAIRTPPNI